MNIEFKDWGTIEYGKAWDLQESLLSDNLAIKSKFRVEYPEILPKNIPTMQYLLFCEHPPVYTLGKSGNINNVLLSPEALEKKGIAFYHTNRGGDITFHGPGQLVGYPMLDLEKYYTDIGKYLRNLEQVIINVLASFDIIADRSKGETGVWLDPENPFKARKICAIGVRCSRWITMHGFAFNINTDLDFFGGIVPCGIQNKQVTSLQKELGAPVDMETIKMAVKNEWAKIFDAVFNEKQ
jgi:lipoyl(octanoyl) transferase